MLNINILNININYKKYYKIGIELVKKLIISSNYKSFHKTIISDNINLKINQ